MANQPGNVCSGAHPFFGDLYIQFGTIQPFTGTSTDATSAAIRTNLSTIEFAIASVADTYASGFGTDVTHPVSIDRAITSGATYLHRSTNGVNNYVYNYLLIGTLNATD